MDVQFGQFVWDDQKEAENVLKHGLDFRAAVAAFLDPDRKIFTDQKHSAVEERIFCIGKVDGKIMTVRFTYRDSLIRIIGAGYWRKGRSSYHEK